MNFSALDFSPLVLFYILNSFIVFFFFFFNVLEKCSGCDH